MKSTTIIEILLQITKVTEPPTVITPGQVSWSMVMVMVMVIIIIIIITTITTITLTLTIIAIMIRIIMVCYVLPSNF